MIESKENKKIKYIRHLRENKFMKEEKKFVVEGDHLVKEAKLSGVLLETYSTYERDYGVLNNVVSKNVMDYISTLPSSTDVIGVCKFIDNKEELGKRIIILDNVQDPGNIGTIIRSAKAFNVDTVVLGKGTVKKYNEKVIRASQGMLFKVNIIEEDLKTFIPRLKNDGYLVYGTDVIGGKDVKNVNLEGKVALVLGNEGNGVSQDIKELVNDNLYIKINDDCESLNVAVAASILMYEMAKGDE